MPASNGLSGKTLFITGASRGIGRSLALRAAKDGANIVIVSKTAEKRDDLDGTIHSVAAEVEEAGGKALAIATDIRDEDAVKAAVDQAAARFGGIDILVNNASAIHFFGTEDTPLKRYDLMMDVNARGTFTCVQACLPHLAKSGAGKILTMSPPLNLNTKWLGVSPAYTLSKYGMSLLTMGFAAEFAHLKITANTLWPRTLIATDAVRVNFGAMYAHARRPEIVADAAHLILSGLPGNPTAQHFIDEDVLRDSGVSDFDAYALEPGQPLSEDIFLD